MPSNSTQGVLNRLNPAKSLLAIASFLMTTLPVANAQRDNDMDYAAPATILSVGALFVICGVCFTRNRCNQQVAYVPDNYNQPQYVRLDPVVRVHDDIHHHHHEYARIEEGRSAPIAVVPRDHVIAPVPGGVSAPINDRVSAPVPRM